MKPGDRWQLGTKYFSIHWRSMVAPVVKPLSISLVSGSVLVFIESALLGALPTLALISTFLGPFVPTAAGAWNRRKVLSAMDAQAMYGPVYEEIHKNRDAIQSSKTWSNFPLFQTNTLDQIRTGALYQLLQNRTPAVEALRTQMAIALDSQADARRATSQIIRDTIGPALGENGVTVAFRARTRDGSLGNFEGDMWITPILMVGGDPFSVFRQQRMVVESIAIKDRTGNDTGILTFPKDESKSRQFWDSLEKQAKNNPDIKKFREALGSLPGLAEQAENQVLKEIKKSRSIF